MIDDKLSKVRAEIERRYNEYMAKDSELAAIRADECLGILSFIDSMQEEPKECMYSKDNYTDEDRKVLCDGCEEECEFKPTTSVWHDASEEPNDKSSCLIYYMVGGEVSYRDIFPVLYNKEAREFISEPYPHPTGYKVEQSSLEGGVVAEVYKNMRDRFPLSDIYKWAYIDDLIKL